MRWRARARYYCGMPLILGDDLSSLIRSKVRASHEDHTRTILPALPADASTQFVNTSSGGAVMTYKLWKTAARKVVAWRHPLEAERARVGTQLLVSFDCGHDKWIQP